MRAREFIFEYKRAITARNYSSKLIDRLSQDTGLQASFAGRSAADIADLKAQLNDNPEIQEYILSKFEAADPTKNKQYTQWIISRYIRGDFLYEELPKVKSNIKKFIESAKLIQNKDLNQYTYQDLKNTVNSIYKNQSDSKKQGGAIYPVLPNTRVLYNGPLGQLVIPETTQASMALQRIGHKTVWCTADSRAPTHFKDYASRGPLYVWIDKGGNKYQFHFETQEFMDKDNQKLSDNKLIDFFTKNSVLSKLAKEKILNGNFLYLYPYVDKSWIESQPEVQKKISIYNEWKSDPLNPRNINIEVECDNCGWAGNTDDINGPGLGNDAGTCPECDSSIDDDAIEEDLHYEREEILREYVHLFFRQGYSERYRGIFKYGKFYDEAAGGLPTDDETDLPRLSELIQLYLENYNPRKTYIAFKDFSTPLEFFTAVIDEAPIRAGWILSDSVKNPRLRTALGNDLEKLQSQCFEEILTNGDLLRITDEVLESSNDVYLLDQGLLMGAIASKKYMPDWQSKIYNFVKLHVDDDFEDSGYQRVYNDMITSAAKAALKEDSAIEIFRIMINAFCGIPITARYNVRDVAKELLAIDDKYLEDREINVPKLIKNYIINDQDFEISADKKSK